MSANITRPEPVVGMAATINLYTDTMAAVVVRVNKKSVTVATVALDEAAQVRINDEREPFPVYATPGILTEIVGRPQRFSRIDTPEGPRFRAGTISVTLGRSVRVIDYRH